jgi:transcription initiation factor TFIIIB Brf1 subunit/transcription initiation factor TFIIB
MRFKSVINQPDNQSNYSDNLSKINSDNLSKINSDNLSKINSAGNIYSIEENDPIDHFNNISDDTLWDILENLSLDKKTNVPTITTLDKFNSKCASCNSFNLIYTSSRGSYVCGDCGIESQEILDESPEWNNYEDGKASNGRCGAPSSVFFPKSSLGTIITAPGYSKVKMLKSWGQAVYKENTLAKVLNDIETKCKKYRITKAIIDGAKILYKNLKQKKHDSGSNEGKNVIIRGFNCKQIVAACFHFAAILQKQPRSTKEVSDIFDMTDKQITKGCRKFLEIMKDNFIIFDIKPSCGSDFIKRFGSKIELSNDTIELAKTISDNATKLDIASNHQSTSIAAASILMAVVINNDKNITKKNIASAFAISDVTISITYKKIFLYKDIILND